MPASSTAYSPNQLPNLASGPKTGAHSPPALASRASRKILPGCLPATGSIRLSKRNEDSIAIHDPPDQVGITLALDGLVVRILRTGDHAVIAGAEVSVLRLKDADKWSHADHELWRRMAADVAEYKRMTRRGKVNVTKARVRYSFSINEMVLDTASRRASGELHKTKRLVPLRHRHIAPDRQSPYKAKEKEKAKDKDAVEAAAAALGVVVGPDWSVAEREAVRRLWATRVQWGQYVIAANEDKL
ncbi:uncharacterized protein EHS24_004079 [Apiotrichum porosum]|uniref:Uncharacterized protein n=1 Tax=Apiotrichum porosum TaxID=105984 RepID=A0A427Y477_9TREE|nr:uncharacterized protein EHS24_004079 [Apiotrichum porosum]RSH85894.1 hypothetical protein EHS24_004079 [Apiotrichum porosum]